MRSYIFNRAIMSYPNGKDDSTTVSTYDFSYSGTVYTVDKTTNVLTKNKYFRNSIGYQSGLVNFKYINDVQLIEEYFEDNAFWSP